MLANGHRRTTEMTAAPPRTVDAYRPRSFWSSRERAPRPTACQYLRSSAARDSSSGCGRSPSSGSLKP